MAEQKLYTAKQLAEVLQVHPQTVYRMAERGEIESYKIGKSVRFVMPGKERQNNGTEEDTRAAGD